MEENNEVKEIFNMVAKDENFSSLIISEEKELTKDNVINLVNEIFKKYKTYFKAKHYLAEFSADVQEIETFKYEQIEKERLEDFKYLLSFCLQMYNGIIKNSIPYLFMRLLREDKELLNDTKLSNLEISFLNNNDLYQCTSEALDLAVVNLQNIREDQDYYSYYIQILNEELNLIFKEKQNKFINFNK